MKVSIIVPIYNVQDYLEVCLTSIINQTYSNIEVILVDDGSTDLSSEICAKYLGVDRRIEYYYKKNGGLSDARNYGLEMSTGDYVVFIDSDDYISPFFVETLLTDLISNRLMISCVGIRKVCSQNGGNEVTRKDVENSSFVILDEKKALINVLSSEEIGNFAVNKIFKKELFLNVNFPSGRVMEDLGTMYRLIIESKNIGFRNVEMYYYLQRDGSILSSKLPKFYIDKLELSFERYSIIKKLYPSLVENYIFFINTYMECSKFLRKKDLVPYKIEFEHSCNRILKTKKVKNRIKYIIKIVLFKVGVIYGDK